MPSNMIEWRFARNRYRCKEHLQALNEEQLTKEYIKIFQELLDKI
jgi:hypothetical protein